MPADRQDLEERITAATPLDTVRGLFFNAIFSTVREHRGDGSARATDPLGRGSRAAFLSYPVVDFLRIAWNAADVLEGVYGDTGQAFYEMGRRSAQNVFESLWGRTLLSLAGGAEHGLAAQIGAGYRGAVSYGERSLEWTGPRSCVITFTRDFLVPNYHCGVFAAALQVQGAQGVRAEGRQVGLLDAEYDVSWE